MSGQSGGGDGKPSSLPFLEDIRLALAEKNRRAAADGEAEEQERKRRMLRRLFGADGDGDEEKLDVTTVVPETSGSESLTPRAPPTSDSASVAIAIAADASLLEKQDLSRADLHEWVGNNVELRKSSQRVAAPSARAALCVLKCLATYAAPSSDDDGDGEIFELLYAAVVRPGIAAMQDADDVAAAAGHVRKLIMMELPVEGGAGVLECLLIPLLSDEAVSKSGLLLVAQTLETVLSVSPTSSPAAPVKLAAAFFAAAAAEGADCPDPATLLVAAEAAVASDEVLSDSGCAASVVACLAGVAARLGDDDDGQRLAKCLWNIARNARVTLDPVTLESMLRALSCCSGDSFVARKARQSVKDKLDKLRDDREAL